LRLDQVWLLVSPGNPLKPQRGMAALPVRLESARLVSSGRQIVATAVESKIHTRYTVQTLRMLRIRFPRARFVWLMGADNLVQLPRWNEWMEIARHTPFAVMPRPTYNHRALAGLASQRLRRWRKLDRSASALADGGAPGWMFVPAAQNHQSATAIRARLRRAIAERASKV
jgi:nicotinate-nucleotide adenylyltransferase